jgi:hypothetical protein
VGAQTFRGFEHLVHVDEERAGCAKTMNHLAGQAQGDWLFLLADDDLLLPRCLDTHLGVSAEADVVYAPPLVWGEDATQFHQSPPGIPAVALIRAEFWRRLGGYAPDATHMEDRDLWCRALERQARFVRADQAPTWIYRFWGGNKSRL